MIPDFRPLLWLSLPFLWCSVASAQTADQLLQKFAGEFIEIRPGQSPYAGGHVSLGAAGKGQLPVVQVEIGGEFRMGRYEVTQELYEAVMGRNPSRWKGPRNSVELMTLSEAEEFCQRATDGLRRLKLLEEGQRVRLPTEVEWEYCCRAGTATRYSFGDVATAAGDEGNKATLLDPYAWHTGNAAGNDPPVGALKPNPWGLYDMHGYLSEFVTADERLSGVAKPDAGLPVILRGGSWKDHHSLLTSSARRQMPADTKDDAVGFRCVISR
jgi:formylglycine-generating enzyme required for sulfatase activity